MGSPETETNRKPNEGSANSRNVDPGFWLGETMVTIEQWKKVMGLDLRAQLTRRITDDTAL